MRNHLYIVGVRKCGTTSIFDSLAGDPRFAAPRVKEPQFFTQPDAVLVDHASWYEDLWREGAAGIRLDGSTLYYQFPDSYHRILAYSPTAVFLLCLRDPARRFYSAYWHMRSKPGAVEIRPLSKVLAAYQTMISLPVEERLAAEEALIQQAIFRGEIDGKYLNDRYLQRHYRAPFSTVMPDPQIFFRYMGESMYHRNYPPFENLPASSVILFEEFVREPDRVLGKVLEDLNKCLDLSPQFLDSPPPKIAPNYNKTLDANQSRLMRGLTRAGLYDTLKQGLGTRSKQLVKRLLYGQIPKMSEKEYDLLRQLLREEYDFWAEKFPVTKTLWQYRS